MDIIAIIMAVFAAVAAVDLIIGNKLGLGKEFERGIHMLGEITLSMMGMIVLSPVLAAILTQPLTAISGIVPIDPSSFIGAILANDMGGAPLATEIAKNSISNLVQTSS